MSITPTLQVVMRVAGMVVAWGGVNVARRRSRAALASFRLVLRLSSAASRLLTRDRRGTAGSHTDQRTDGSTCDIVHDRPPDSRATHDGHPSE